MKKFTFSLVFILALLVGCEKKKADKSSLSEDTTSEKATSSDAGLSNDISSSEGSETSASQNPDSFPQTPVGIEVPTSVFNYYVNVNFNLTGNSLKGELYNKISVHTSHSYGSLFDLMKTTDRDWNLSPDPSDSNPYMVLIYATYNFKTSSAKRWDSKSNGVYDKEHIWAKSHGNFGNNAPAGTDLHHLRASDQKNNSSRGNLDFGTVSGGKGVTDYSGSASGKTGSSTTKNGSVYEPLDIYKGDVARAMFYMATRYSSFNTSGGNEHRNLVLVDNITKSSTGNGQFGIVSELLKWHAADPVDEFEFNRNGLVQEKQKNRNPYIDFPELATKVFG